MKRLLVLAAALALAAGAARPLSAQAEDPSTAKVRISWDDFKKLYDEKNVVVVDVRGNEAYAVGHIPGARSIPLPEVERHAEELKKLTSPIVLYCA